MKIRAWTAAALLLAACATTQPVQPPVRWGSGEILLGDERQEVLQVTGRLPDRSVPMVTENGVPLGEQWMFISRDPKQRELLWVELMRGRVTKVWTEPMAAER